MFVLVLIVLIIVLCLFFNVVLLFLRLICLVICVYCVVVLCIFFFFKQKTAYEMRISDWSSDVCSSDLVWRLELAGSSVILKRNNTMQTLKSQDLQIAMKIGRASCRERVCQYV